MMSPCESVLARVRHIRDNHDEHTLRANGHYVFIDFMADVERTAKLTAGVSLASFLAHVDDPMLSLSRDTDTALSRAFEANGLYPVCEYFRPRNHRSRYQEVAA